MWFVAINFLRFSRYNFVVEPYNQAGVGKQSTQSQTIQGYTILSTPSAPIIGSFIQDTSNHISFGITWEAAPTREVLSLPKMPSVC